MHFVMRYFKFVIQMNIILDKSLNSYLFGSSVPAWYSGYIQATSKQIRDSWGCDYRIFVCSNIYVYYSNADRL